MEGNIRCRIWVTNSLTRQPLVRKIRVNQQLNLISFQNKKILFYFIFDIEVNNKDIFISFFYEKLAMMEKHDNIKIIAYFQKIFNLPGQNQGTTPHVYDEY